VSNSSLSNVIAVSVLFARDCVVVFVTEQPTNVEPLAGAAHLSPVASALSATILQEQSQRIVLRGLKRLDPQQLNQGLPV
jgi:hypothetical protein